MVAASQIAEGVEIKDFSPLLGGPLFQFYRRVHLSGPGLEYAARRIFLWSSIAWIPLVILQLIGQQAGPGARPFWFDIELHVKLLISLPLLIAGEAFAHRRLVPLAKRFVARHIIRVEDMPRYISAVESALRLRDSAVLELVLLILVYTAGVWLWRSQSIPAHASWYCIREGPQTHLTRAGLWYAFVSVPIVQFMILRWYLRIILWFGLLWRISRLNLHLIATHPDGAGGIGFLGTSSYAFVQLLIAQTTLASAKAAGWVLFDGRSLSSFQTAAGLLVFILLAFIFGPLLVFMFKLDAAKRKGSAEYGLVASQYVLNFDRKWVRHEPREVQPILGSPDIQALADMANSFAVVRSMRIVPFSVQDVTHILILTIAPLIPLELLVMPVDSLVKILSKLVM